MEPTAYKSKVTAVVAGLALAGGLTVVAPQAAYAEDYATLTSGGSQPAAEQTLTSDDNTQKAVVPYGASGGATDGTVENGATEGGAASDDLTDATNGGAASKPGTTDETITDGSDAVADKPVDGDGTADGTNTDDSFTVDDGIATFDENKEEKDVPDEVEADGWHEDGDNTYYVSKGKRVTNSWLITSGYKNYGTQRYWFGTDGLLAKSRLIDPTKESSSYYAYATQYGYVVRGRYTDPTTGNVYFANNDGKLENPGWHVSSSYGQGLQRYYIDATTHSAVAGYSSDGYAHYTTSAGYVLRGTYKTADGKVYLADNDGKLARSGNSSDGWVVSSAYGQGLQRYYVAGHDGSDGGYATVGYSTDSWDHYTTNAGYVLRGVYKSGSDWYYANNDGKLVESCWLITSSFGQGLQRYWVGSDNKVAFNRYVSSAETKSYATYATNKGYVLRGTLKVGDKVYLADNDGKLARSGSSSAGWVVSSAYGQGLQRYYVAGHDGSDGGYATVGFSNDGWAHYTTSAGYVLRNGTQLSDDNTKVYFANNDGAYVSYKGWVISSSFGHGLQRYWFEDGGYTLVGYSADGWAHYTTTKGYVLRGVLKVDDKVYLANNDGRLARAGSSSAGWVVSSAYGQGLQRYWVEGHDGTDGGYAKVGFSDGGYAHYTTTSGYVLRGKTKLTLPTSVKVGYSTITSGVIVANNDGKLLTDTVEGVKRAAASSESGGWYVGSALDGAAQRYWFIESNGHIYAAVGEFFFSSSSFKENNGNGSYKQYYGRDDQGYVVRGTYRSPANWTYEANNDGVVLSKYHMSAAAQKAWSKIKNYSSRTQYLIYVDYTECLTIVFQGSAGNWNPIYEWDTGMPMSGHERTGDYTIGGDGSYYYWSHDRNYRYYDDGDYRISYFGYDDIKYFTCFILDMGFHSTVGYNNGHNYSDRSQLGRHISYGCLRLLESNAKWIYDNATVGTRVIVSW